MSSARIKISVNGELRDFSAGITLLHILREEGYSVPERKLTSQTNANEQEKNYIAAVNQRIISADEYANYYLNADDAVDVLGVITGG